MVFDETKNEVRGDSIIFLYFMYLHLPAGRNYFKSIESSSELPIEISSGSNFQELFDRAQPVMMERNTRTYFLNG